MLCSNSGDASVSARTLAESDEPDMPTERFGRIALPSVLALLVASFPTAGCGGLTQSSTINPQTVTGSTFVVGTDAPVESVTSFAVQVQNITASDGTNTVSLLSGSPTVDFA